MRQEGYKFVPSASQGANFEALVRDDWNGLVGRYDRDNDGDMEEGQQYRLSGVEAIYTFKKPRSEDDDVSSASALKVQIIEAETNPLQCVLGFHSRSYKLCCSVPLESNLCCL